MPYTAALKAIFVRRTIAHFMACLLLMQAVLPPALASSLTGPAASTIAGTAKGPKAEEASSGGINVSASDTRVVPAGVDYGIELKQISTAFNNHRAIDYH